MRKKISRLFLFLCVLVAVWFGYQVLKGREYDLRAKLIVDGDTVEMNDGSTVRLMGIDAPDKGEAGFDEAKNTLARLIEKKEVYLEYDRYLMDKYGRKLVWMWVGCEAMPEFLDQNYMQLTGNTSRDGLMVNPVGCLQGLLVNEQMITGNMADIDFYEDRGELKYQKRLTNLQTKRDIELEKKGILALVDVVYKDGVRGKLVQVKKYPGTNFYGYRAFLANTVSVDYLSGKLVLSKGKSQMVMEQNNLDRVMCDDKLSVNYLYKKIKDTEYRYFLVGSKDGRDEYQVCEQYNNGYRLGTKFGFLSFLIPTGYKADIDFWWRVFGDLEDGGE